MPHTSFSLLALLQRLRYAIIPPRRSVFIGGRWILVDPLYPGPAAARLGETRIPAWWILGCRRKATYVGVFDEGTWPQRVGSRSRSEIIIGDGIYQIDETPLSDAEIGRHLVIDAEQRAA